jgi:hypothetical protein
VKLVAVVFAISILYYALASPSNKILTPIMQIQAEINQNYQYSNNEDLYNDFF